MAKKYKTPMTREEITRALNSISDNRDRQVTFSRSAYNDMKIDVNQVRLLLRMAVKGNVPDGRFSDSECNIWSAMRSVLANEEVEFTDI